jgi:hypothetical protein
MIRASALYMAIIIALVIAVLCGALIATAYYYRINYQLRFRQDRLENNLSSALALMQADTLAGQPGKWKPVNLFGTAANPVRYQRFSWGIYDLGIAEAYNSKDTIRSTALLGCATHSVNRTALYVTDEDRPISFSGKTFVRGDAYLPKAGIREAFFNNKGYEGDKALITGGKKKTSAKLLPALNPTRIAQLMSYFHQEFPDDKAFFNADSVFNSFSKPTRYLDFGKTPANLNNKKLLGNIVIVSDTTLTIDSTSHLENVIIAARAVIISPGFHGTCQVLGTDSIIIGKGSRLNYPSAVGVFGLTDQARPKISLGDDTEVNGLVFVLQKKPEDLLAVTKIGLNAMINGEVYASGLFQYKGKFTINGSVFAKRFLFENAFTTYENYLINIRIDTRSLSRYYLTSMLTNRQGGKSQILQWLERK